MADLDTAADAAGGDPSPTAPSTRDLVPEELPRPGRFGEFGGRYVPEALVPALEQLDEARQKAAVDPEFQDELARLHRTYTGRPSIITEVPRFAAHCGGARVVLKREDLNHTGSHKINNVLAQALLTKRMGKSRVIAETGAGQHGVATATAAALMGLDCTVYMGRVDTERQALNVGPDEDPRRRGGARRPRQRHPQGRHQRGTARLGDQRRHDALPHRHRHRPPSLPRDGPRLPRDHRRGGARAGPRAHRAPAGRRHRLRRRRLERHGHLPPLRPGCRGAPHRRRGRGRGRRVRPARSPLRLDGDARGAARRDELPHAGRRRADRRVALDLGGPGLPQRRARARVPPRQRPRRVPLRDRRPGHGGLLPALPHRGDHPRPGVGPRPRRVRWRSGASSAPTPCCSSTSPAAATRTCTRPPPTSASSTRGRRDHRRPRRRGGPRPLPRRGPGRARRLPAGRLPDGRGLDRGDARARRGRLRRRRGRDAVQRPAHGRPRHPACRRDSARRRHAGRRRLPGDRPPWPTPVPLPSS